MDDPEKPKRGRPQKLDANKTLDVAMRAYWDSDPADVSVNAICALAGISKPALYRQFGGEDGLSLAVLDRYAAQVLSDIFVVLQKNGPLSQTLAALIQFASQDPKMGTGCVFFKMRAGKHRLGPKTLERVNEIDAVAVQGFETYLEARRAAGDWQSDQPSALMARYMLEQIGLALTQRATQKDTAQIEASLTLALSVV